MNKYVHLLGRSCIFGNKKNIYCAVTFMTYVEISMEIL